MKMKPVFFTDLDNTLFNSMQWHAGKEPGSLKRVTTASVADNHSYMDAKQQAFYDWIMETMEVIPVTARNENAFKRVHVEFNSYAVATNGALVLNPDGSRDEEWRATVAELAAPYAERMRQMHDSLADYFAKDLIRGRVIDEDGISIYAGYKSNGEVALLDEVMAVIRENVDLAGFHIHKNGNNLSYNPSTVSKLAAVEYLLRKPELQGRIRLTAGDSLTDMEFMAAGDFMLVPPNTQVANSIDRPLAAPAADLPIGTAGSGSYAKADVRFLLNDIQMPPTSVDEKERLIQSGRAHYSEMISPERVPDERYLAIYEQACRKGVMRTARDAKIVAEQLRRTMPGRLALCSLVRAGTPFGVILKRLLAQPGAAVEHFGVSIIRDRGIDQNAMNAVLRHYDPAEIVFVDGWTGKGVIADELQQSWEDMTGRRPRLAVLADPCGRADFSASHEDWLIPFGLLGSIVSGLISRSILNQDYVQAADFHGCNYLTEMAPHDRSADFADRVMQALRPPNAVYVPAVRFPAEDRCRDLQGRSRECVERLMQLHGCERNLVKPGIAEATRAVLRRKPQQVYVRTDRDPDVKGLLHLCKTDGVDCEANAGLTGPYRAVTIIGKVK